jgi:hypothetical protein
MADPRPSLEEIRQELVESLRSGLLFGRYDEPLDAAGKRIVRVIEQRLLAVLPQEPAPQAQAAVPSKYLVAREAPQPGPIAWKDEAND